MQLPRGGDADTINQGAVLPHYDDLFALWQRGEGVPIAWTPEEIRGVVGRAGPDAAAGAAGSGLVGVVAQGGQ